MLHNVDVNANIIYECVVKGEPASKANSRRLVTIGGRPRFIKSKKALDYVKAFEEQVDALDDLIECDVAAHITIHYKTRRPDLDESVILDCLQGVAYKNDRQVKEKHIYWALDREDPRSTIRLVAIKTDSA
jgi:Holliday junction resolvase RusA-like endonuclease|tara:strand:+ start:1269 stop:1661 length:393 start_codon:yes stop_codon:yes gene_type:complete